MAVVDQVVKVAEIDCAVRDMWTGICMCSWHSMEVPRWTSLRSVVTKLPLWVDRTLLIRILAVVRSAAWVLTLPGKSTRSLPKVQQTHGDFTFAGRAARMQVDLHPHGSCGDWGGAATLRCRTGSGSGSSDGLRLGMRPVMSLERIFRAATWVSVNGFRGDPGFGLQRASRMSWMPARIMQLEEVRGMQTSVGNHKTLSQSWMV
jgi:hypothetical protein